MNDNCAKDYIDAKAEALKVSQDSLRVELDERFRAIVGEFRAEMHTNTADVIKWMVGLTISSLAIFISFMALMLNNVNVTLNAALKAAAAASPTVQQPAAPIIIQMPPYPPAAPKP